MTPTATRSPVRPRWRRYGAVASTLVLYLLWGVLAPLIGFGLGLTGDFQLLLVGLAGLTVLLALGFTFRGSWAANGFRGGLQLKSWRMLWPLWAAVATMLAMSAADRSPEDHLLWFALCLFIGFTEEAIFRGIILRALLPGGMRNAVLWSAFWFGASHLVGFVGADARVVLLTVAGAFASGLVFAWVRLQSGSIWPCVIAHGVFDYSCLVDAGGLRESMMYTPYQAITSALLAIVTLAWACWLIFRSAPTDAGAARSRFDDLVTEPLPGA